MTRNLNVGAAIALACGVLSATSPDALAGAPTPLTTTLSADGMVRPIYVTHAPGDFGRIFVLEKQGRIRIINLATNTLLATPFLDIDAIVGGGTTTQDERGLLGLAFHPNYNSVGAQGQGTFYVYYTDNSSNTAVARYTVSGDPNVANTTGDIIFTLAQPFTNHNGGYMQFGPDNYLYISLGDGGSSCDPSQRAQNLSDLHGKILRIDINGDDFPGDVNRDYAIPPTNPFAVSGGAPEVWLWGLRNAWRPTFDRATGDLYIADVGQGQREEIDYRPAGSNASRNYGWDCMEGTACSTISGCSPSGCTCGDPNLVLPIYEYDHTLGRCSITGGYVYRGCAIPDLQGTYFFADYCGNQIYSFRVAAGAVEAGSFQERTTELAPGGGRTIVSITSFGEDAFGELYICDQNGGEVFKIVPRMLVGPDCNNNGRRDACDILAGSSTDNNHNGVPDECDPAPCPADLNGDGSVGAADLAILLGSWGGGGAADFDGGGVGSSDLAILLGSWGPCP